jgi:thiol-disulfide isomerase/thioredoxin
MRFLIGFFALCLLFAAGPKLAPVNEVSFPKIVAAHRGKVVLVDFWATWCVPCRKEMPELMQLESRLRSKGFQLITISADEPEKQAEAEGFLAKYSVPAPAYIRKADDDDKFINSIDPKWSGALPALFLFDRSGRKVKMFVGETSIKNVEAAVVKLL